MLPLHFPHSLSPPCNLKIYYLLLLDAIIACTIHNIYFKKHIANYKNHNFFIIPSSYLVYFIQLNILSIIGHILFVIHFQCC